jgi:hypothetical protein
VQDENDGTAGASDWPSPMPGPSANLHRVWGVQLGNGNLQINIWMPTFMKQKLAASRGRSLANVREAKGPIRMQRSIAVWGAPGTGKTTYLAALNIALAQGRQNWALTGADEASTQWLARATGELVTLSFPVATQGIASHERSGVEGNGLVTTADWSALAEWVTAGAIIYGAFLWTWRYRQAATDGSPAPGPRWRSVFCTAR